MDKIKWANKALHNLNSAANVVIVIKKGTRWAKHVKRMGKKRDAQNIFLGRAEARTPFRICRRSWED
jgi:hypothetical protein